LIYRHCTETVSLKTLTRRRRPQLFGKHIPHTKKWPHFENKKWNTISSHHRPGIMIVRVMVVPTQTDAGTLIGDGPGPAGPAGTRRQAAAAGGRLPVPVHRTQALPGSELELET
jgi:hypothetical protein